MTDTLQSLRAALDGNLIDFEGLPANLSIDIFAGLHGAVLPEPRPGRLAGRRCEIWDLSSSERFPEVRAWSKDRIVILVELSPPSQPVFSKTLQAELGQPDIIQPELDRMITGDVVEWVYAERGFELSVLQPDEPPTAQVITHVRLFASGSVEEYRSTIEGDGPTFRFLE